MRLNGLILCLMSVFLIASPAIAACTDPHGEGGDILFNADSGQMQYCDGTGPAWTAMGGGGGGGSDNLGDHTATQNLLMGGFNIRNAGTIQVGTMTTCGATDAGVIRYIGGSTPWEYCDGGGTWRPFKQPRCVNDATGECYLATPRSGDDGDFVAGNIRSGTNILGVTGTLAAPANCTNDATGECVLNATRSSSDAEFLAANIRNGVNVLGVTGTYTGGGTCTAVDTQTYSTPGTFTWTKPGSGEKVYVECWGGGGGGVGRAVSGRSIFAGPGGGGGGYNRIALDRAALPATVAVTVGGGGAVGPDSGTAGSGGSSSFGAYVSAGGGAGANGSNSGAGGTGFEQGGRGNGEGGAQIYSSGGGAVHTGSPGTSIYGGNGSPYNGVAGAPGGGGAGGHRDGSPNATPGAPGRCIVTTYPGNCRPLP